MMMGGQPCVAGHGRSDALAGQAHLVPEERAGDVDLLAPDDRDLLSVKDLLGQGGREPTEKVALAVDNDGGGCWGERAEAGSKVNPLVCTRTER
jgi:hypothetical protein